VTAHRKVVEASQAAINDLLPESGEWKVRGVLGLLVWKGKHSTSFRLVRRIHGRLVKRTLAARSLAEARREAIRVWKSLTPPPPDAQPMPTLRQAVEAYITSKTLAARTREEYAETICRYLADWLDRRLDALAADRAGFRKRMLDVQRKHGAATAALLIRTYRAIHNWHRKVLSDLAESPTVACETPRVKPRDWALSDEELRAWWGRVRELPAVKRVWYLTALMTGARAGSVTALRWDDVDLERRLIRFRVVKGDRPYVIPLADRLAGILTHYREKAWLPNRDGWVFPSPLRRGRPLFRQVKTRGIAPPHSLRHTMRTRLAEAGAPPDLARVALGHSLGQNVSERYITASLLTEAVRPLMNAVAEKYAAILGWAQS
jgi:integrase